MRGRVVICLVASLLVSQAVWAQNIQRKASSGAETNKQNKGVNSARPVAKGAAPAVNGQVKGLFGKDNKSSSPLGPNRDTPN